MFMRSTRSAGRFLQPLRAQQRRDGLGEIGDVAGGLRREGRAEIDLRHRPFHVVAEALQQPPRLLQLRHQLGRGAVVAPFVESAMRSFPGSRRISCVIGLGHRPVRHELARRAAAAGIHEGGGVAHRAVWQPWMDTTLARSEP
jgi:hypothetical protein